MRIMQVSGTFPPGRCGVGDYTAALSDALARVPGCQVAVLTRDEHGRSEREGVHVIAGARTWRPWELPRISREMRRWAPDLVHIHWPSQGFGWRLAPALLPAICRRHGIRVVQTWHEPWLPQDTFRFRLQRRATDGLVFVRPNLVSLMPAHLRARMPDCPQRVIGSGPSLPVSTLSDAGREALRRKYLRGKRTLVVYFGFIYPKKGVESLFDIADPRTDALVLAGGMLDRAYGQQLRDLASGHGWKEDFHETGYLEPAQAADLLRAADAVVLPYVGGGGEWSTSIHGALIQGTVVITTATVARGYDAERNLYTSRIGDIAEMRHALREFGGRRLVAPPADGWDDVAHAHVRFYRELMPPPITE